ncbi:MAG: hypothetical protein LBJ46_10770, partial [Planctomycetota bacterium]|nr:hypothetical protein [Planctomycetota bacterium]
AISPNRVFTVNFRCWTFRSGFSSIGGKRLALLPQFLPQPLLHPLPPLGKNLLLKRAQVYGRNTLGT